MCVKLTFFLGLWERKQKKHSGTVCLFIWNWKLNSTRPLRTRVGNIPVDVAFPCFAFAIAVDGWHQQTFFRIVQSAPQRTSTALFESNHKFMHIELITMLCRADFCCDFFFSWILPSGGSDALRAAAIMHGMQKLTRLLICCDFFQAKLGVFSNVFGFLRRR